MSKTVLYRKYRPQSFEEVLGQEHIVSVLKNAVKTGRISHAYLFSGSRGTGKTSLARILAKEAGCSDVDLIEIDAASSRGIDEIRALREAVRFSPMQGKVKVYVVDECLTADHLITLSDGSPRFISDLKNGDEVLSVDLRLKSSLVSGKVSNWFSRSADEIFYIRTSQAAIKATPNHRLWVARNGKLELVYAKDITRNDFLLSPILFPHKTRNKLTPSQLAFLAMIQCDGHISKDSSTVQVEISKDIDYFIKTFKDGVSAWKFKGNLSVAETKRGTTLIRFYSKELKNALGRLNCPAGKKSGIIDVPDAVFHAPMESIKKYIDTCFCCEGDASFSASTRLYKLSFTSVSVVFAKKIQLLLKKFGISSGIMEIKRKNKKYQNIFRLNLTGYDLRLFQKNVGLSLLRKAKILKGQLRNKEKQDGIPFQSMCLEKRKQLNLSHQFLNKKSIYLDKTQALTRKVFEKFIKIAKLPELEHLLRFRYEKILSVKKKKEKVQVYDFTVAGPHTFVADAICSSNCHMLTKEAFNALLKTLEEPPAHAIFILATTELEKVPETIISRCQNFSFRKISEEILRKALKNIAQKEGFEIDDGTAALVALGAEGSFRDAQGILDQLISMGEKKITEENARRFLSAPPREIIEKFLTAILEKNAGNGLEAIGAGMEKNIEIKILYKMILRDLRSAILLKLAPAMKKQIQDSHSEKEFKFLEKCKDLSKPGELERALKIMLEYYETRSRSYLPQTPLELALLAIIGENK